MTNTYFNHVTPLARFTTADANKLNDILRAIEAGFSKLPTVEEINQGTRGYSIATGTANAYSATVGFPIQGYQAGLTLSVLVMIANTGPSTINVNGKGQVTIKRSDGSNLLPGDLRAASINTFVYDGSVFRLTSFHGASEAITSASAASATAAASSAQISAGSASTSASNAAASAVSASASAIQSGNILEGSRFGLRNLLINSTFWMNQRTPGVFSGTYAANVFIRDRWKAGTSGVTYSISNSIITITAGSIVQVVQGRNIPLDGSYTLSWAGSSTARINGVVVANGGSVTLPKLTHATIEFRTGTSSQMQLEYGAQKTPFEVRSIDLERLLCYQYYQKSYDDETKPGTSTLTGVRQTYSILTGHWATNAIIFTVPMRAAPTVVIQNPYFTDLGGSLQNINNNTPYGYTLANISEKSVNFFNSTGNAPVANQYYYHWTADAEL